MLLSVQPPVQPASISVLEVPVTIWPARLHAHVHAWPTARSPVHRRGTLAAPIPPTWSDQCCPSSRMQQQGKRQRRQLLCSTHNTQHFPMIQTKPSAARPCTCTPSYMHLLSFTTPCRCEMRASPCALAVDIACTWAHKPYLLPLDDPGACGACSLPQGWDSCCGSCWARNGRQIHGSKSMAT